MGREVGKKNKKEWVAGICLNANDAITDVRAWG